MASAEGRPLNIRRARTQDAADLTSLVYLSKQSNGYDDAFMAQCRDELRVTAEDIDTKHIWVAEEDTLLGCVTLEMEEDGKTGMISSFFIHPDSKRKGVGRTLWQHLLGEARTRGLTCLQLDSDPEAVPFYEAMGFEVVGQKPSGSIPGRFLPLMERRLS